MNQPHQRWCSRLKIATFWNLPSCSTKGRQGSVFFFFATHWEKVNKQCTYETWDSNATNWMIVTLSIEK